MRLVLWLALATVLGLGALLAVVALRPNQSRVHPALGIETWAAVADGEHNSNTDLILWRGDLLLVHAASPYHLGTTASRLIVRRSRDGHRWEELSRLQIPGHDVRDPKLAVIGGRLHLYALSNKGVYATPEQTLLSTSSDGVDWSDFEAVGPHGYLFWRPRTRDGRTWYVSAYWHQHGESVLLSSEDGRSWSTVSTIHRGEGNDETAIIFLPDGRLLATARLEVTPDSLLGSSEACTLIAVAEPPYTSWKKRRSRVTRLDGPVLFEHGDRIFAVARHQPGSRGPLTRLGGSFSRKRTALYAVNEQGLVHLSDLPSAGDTSYAGAVKRDGQLFVDYYTSDIRRDYPWILGMFLPTDIRMARLSLDALLALAEAD
jgi:hypothetical protein